ncbi:uncharacterized protein MKK02DRAFT_41482 [Dioszegia hungarica]|uniref:Uncharacterized protein n=1 Tax=Dioszegia hungarica TaxID=4972 RepID=A0AA38H1B3_9TREE|nr:uncharacterized protein MKK02DRAFT_41482 [Dioszegia hungarica]KAI9631852.1 hypothetical protein MKK02DRAFT_41482 [Dioszegia hungarica]
MPLHISGWLDSLLMGFVIAHTFTYWQFIKTDPKHVVALVFSAVAATTAATVIILVLSAGSKL